MLLAIELGTMAMRAAKAPSSISRSFRSVRRQTAMQTARTVASTYRHIHALILREGSGYDHPETILLHAPEEVEALLGLS